MERQPDSPSSSVPANVEFKAVLLLILMASLIVGFVLYVMYARGVFENTQRLVLLSDDSEGVIVGMDVTFSGFPIGRVTRVELAPDGKVRILIDVPDKDAKWLRTSSIFTMERGLVGETRIRAFSNVLEDPPLPPGAERSVLRGDTNAEIPRLVATARSLLENLQTMTSSDSSINSSLADLQTTTKRLNGRYGLLGGALGSDEEARKVIAALDRLNALLSKADQRVFGKQGLVDDVQVTVVQLNKVLGGAQATLKKVDAVLAEAQAVGANARIATEDLGTLRAEVEVSLRKVTTLVDEVNRKWPFASNKEIKLP
ncbi:MAG: mammalian cell entry protein [Burkholderiales bacterium RIFCSPLOWO2_02_FULL_57_36]|nr:MAG: mammalian cell entry protein [Burkholderiales bacterium RIFCSPLOWO2_02_FULL_57_36]